MGRVRIPIDVINPGQVFACLGLLEAAEMHCGPAAGGFTWDSREVLFELEGEGADDPLRRTLEFLVSAEVVPLAPTSWSETTKVDDVLSRVTEFPNGEPTDSAFPIRLQAGDSAVVLDHWADGSSRDPFKLYAGNRSAYTIARTLIEGRTTSGGKVEVQGIRHLWENERLLDDPFGITTPMTGSFNFDARFAWQAIDAGYSPNEHKHGVVGSPVVELMAAWGLQNARPQRVGRRKYRYAIWRGLLPPMLARSALTKGLGFHDYRSFVFEIALSGKNKVVRYAEEEGRA